MAFQSTKGSGNVWNPSVDSEGDVKTVAEKNDFLDGYFVDQRDGVGQYNASIYTLETKEGVRHDVWGTTMLNGEMAKVRRGQYIRIQYLGVLPTKAGALIPEKKRKSTDTFKAWEVFVDDDVAPLQSGGSSAQSVKTTASSGAGNRSPVNKKEEEEDLPF